MNTIDAVIEKGKDGFYCIYLPDIPGLYGSGETENDAKLDLMDNIIAAHEHVKEVKEWGDYLPLKDYSGLKYKYDLSGFFMTYNYFDVTALANEIGINASLMRRYKTGNAKAGKRQKQKIENSIHEIAKKLSAVRL